MLRLLRRSIRGRPRAATMRRPTFRPALERLEDRWAPAVLTVNSLADNSTADSVLTLREAIQVVDGNLGRALATAEQAQIAGTLGSKDTIQFNLPAGAQTIILSGGMLSITQPVAINGPGAGNLTINGNNARRDFYVGQSFSQNLGLVVSLSGLTVASGKDQYGGGLFNAATLTLNNVTFSGNTATTNGGGGVYNNGALTLNNCTFTGNSTLPNGSSTTSGGGLLNLSAGTVTATTCTFSGNTAAGTGSAGGQGGAIANSGTMTVSGSTITGNTAGFGGGGVYNGTGSLTLTNCTVSHNTALANAVTPNQGGGLLNEVAATVTITGCTFSGNAVQGSGGTAGQGGGVYNSGGTATINNSNFTGNSAPSDGGAVYTRISGPNNPVSIKDSTFTNNYSAADGGAIRVHYYSYVYITGCTFVGNTASSEGGAIDGSVASLLSVTNSTFTGNYAGTVGGALQCGYYGTTQLTNDTITGNRVGSIYGGGINIRSAGVILRNTIVVGNFQGGGTTPNDASNSWGDGSPADLSSSYNLIGTGGSARLINGFNHNQVGVTNPGLGALANNGGPTQTIALLPGSPAIDHGSNADVTAGETDQRGFTRIVNGTVDIGAFEVQASSPETIAVNSLADNTTVDNVLTLREAILFADGTLGRALTAGEQAQVTGTMGLNPTIQFNLPVGPQTITLTGGALDLTGSFTINGPGASNLTINGNNADRVFIVGRIWSRNLSQVDAINGLTISGGAQSYGAGVLNFGSLSMNNDTVSNNTAGSSGGGGVYNVGALTFNNCTFTGNSVTGGGSGGAIDNISSGSLTVSSCTFSSNTASGGASGGAIANSGQLTVLASTFTGNSADSNAGAIFNSSGATLTVTTCAIANNTSGSDGGGIDSDGAATITTSTLSGNRAASEGAGLCSKGSQLTMTNCTVYGNTAVSDGGGLTVSSGTTTLTNCTITANRVTAGAGGVYGGGIDAASPVKVFNTIIAGNFQGAAASTTANDVAGILDATSAYNLLGVGGAGGLTNGVNGNQVGVVNLGLDALANNGGPTMTVALLAGSPAIDHGSNAYVTAGETDQRGLTRIVYGSVDIGAFEKQ